MTLTAAAAAFSVSPATAHRWWHRWLEAGEEARRTLSCPFDRSSRPHRGRLPLRALLAARPPRDRRPLAVLARPQCRWYCGGREPRGLRRPSRSRLTATSGPAPATCCTCETRVGYDYAHAIVDDRSRLAFVELHDDEKATTVTGFVERSLAFYGERGIVVKRLMTDNAFAYVHSRSLSELLARHGIRSLTTEPYRPRTNGKVERFHQTMAREWAYGLSYRSHRQRNQALPHWLDHYNTRRPHSSLADRPPVSRIHNLRG
jgi:transposase InsO family protein